MRRPPLLIFPLNGNAIEAVDCIADQYELAGFIDDDPAKQGPAGFHGVPVFSREAIRQMPGTMILAAPGSPATYLNRDHLILELGIDAERFATAVHPRAVVSRHARIGYNVIIMAGVVITSNAVIGNHACVLPNTVIHHDSVVGDFTLIGSNVTIAGRVGIGRKCYIGAGSNIMNDIDVGDESLVGMGANVIRNVAARAKVAGNPAMPIECKGARKEMR